MNSLEKLFVPYQEAFDMKLLGFNEECLAYWNIDPQFKNPLFNIRKPFKHEWVLPSPTYSQCFSWFREKYDIYGEIYPFFDKWQFQLHCLNKEDLGACYTGFPDMEYLTYPEAELECLKQLIRISKNENT